MSASAMVVVYWKLNVPLVLQVWGILPEVVEKWYTRGTSGSLTDVATSSTPPRSQVEESTCEKWCYCEKEENDQL